MTQAIVTKYYGPTNTRGSRIKATADAGSITVPYDHALSMTGVHDAAALALVAKLGWNGAYGLKTMVRGGLPGDSSGYVYVWDVDFERVTIPAA